MTDEQKTGSGGSKRSVRIGENIPASALKGLASFIETYYLTPNLSYFTPPSFQQSASKDGQSFEFDWNIDLTKMRELIVASPSTISVRLVISPSICTVEFQNYDTTSSRVAQLCDRVADDLEAVIVSYMTNAKRTSLNFVFSLGGAEKMEAPSQTQTSLRKQVIKKIFAGNAVNLYLMLTVISFVFIILLGYYALIVMLVIQFLALFFSDRVVMGAGVVRPNNDQQEVTVVTVMSTPEDIRSLSSKGDKVMNQIREQLRKTVQPGDVRSPETKLAIHNVLFQAGVNCTVGDIEVKTRNPYSLVKSAAERFGLPMPKVSVVSTPMDNAAATGISPSRASMTITAGALEDLDDNELEAVIGHELGHIKGRDPVILFFVTTIMYLGGIFLWFPLLLDLGFFYFILAFAVIYLVGKFLETRADTESAAVLGTPIDLASALTQIGFRQLYFEKYSPPIRFFDWFRFDPHPPIYFRVRRLSKIAASGEKIKHALLDSIRDIISGFFGALIGQS